MIGIARDLAQLSPSSAQLYATALAGINALVMRLTVADLLGFRASVPPFVLSSRRLPGRPGNEVSRGPARHRGTVRLPVIDVAFTYDGRGLRHRGT